MIKQNSLCCKKSMIGRNILWWICDFQLRQITFIYILWFSDFLTKGDIHILKYYWNFEKFKVFSYETDRPIVFPDATSMSIWSSGITESHKKHAISYLSITFLLFWWYLITADPGKLTSSNALYSLQAFCLLKPLSFIINYLSINY